MKVSCNIIKDLLPLYAEDMVSEESKNLVDEHLCECDACTKELGVLKKAPKVPVEVDSGSLKRVGDTIRRRRIIAVLTVLLFMITLGMSCVMLLDAKIYMTAEQAVQSVERRENGDVVIYLKDNVSGVKAIQYEGSENYGIVAWSNLSKLLFRSERVSYEDLSDEYRLFYSEEEYEEVSRFIIGKAESYNVWYCDAYSGKAEMLLWDGDNPEPTHTLVNPNYQLACYCGILTGIATLLAIPGWKIKEKWYGELCARFSILFGCICLSTVIVSAGQFMEILGIFNENIRDGLIVAVPMTLTALFARQLHKLNKQDKGK